MTGEQLREQYIQTEHGLFTPSYEFETYDGEIDTYTGLVIKKTAQEVYAEWLHNLNNPQPQEPTEVEVLQEKVSTLELMDAGLLLENATQQVKIQEQEVTTANLLLEVALLKGGI